MNSLLPTILSVLVNSQLTFTLTDNAIVSAGVYQDDVLKRVLIVNEPYTSGTYNIYWDGTDEYGNNLPGGEYNIKVKWHNITATWRGAKIGNTSSALSGSSIHHGISYLSDISVSGTKAVYAAGYSERLPSIVGFATTNPQVKLDVYAHNSSNPTTQRLSNDDTNFYYAGIDAYASTHSFIYATAVSDNSKVTFLNGTDYTLSQLGDTYNAIGLLDNANGAINDLAVQAGNDYLYFTRPALNTIYVLNKSTGAAVNTITTFTNPKSISFDKNGHLWISYGTDTINRFTVNSDGSLTSDGVSITGITNPGKVNCSYGSTQVGVIDLATNQLKIFSNVDGSFIRNIGSGESYLIDSVVANDKFFFDTTGGAGFCFVQSDNSIWLADTGNNRFLHFSETGMYIETLMRQGTLYITRIDESNPSRVFGNYSEFSIPDYNAIITSSSGWSFVRNWAPQINDSIYTTFEGLKSVHTFTDGTSNRTFAFLRLSDGTGCELIELQANGQIRFTGVIKNAGIIDKDGAILTFNSPLNPYEATLTLRYYYKGSFDSNSNPLWNGTEESLADLIHYIEDPSNTDDHNLANAGVYGIDRPYTTNDNKVVFYQIGAGISPNYITGHHIGVSNRGGSTFINKFAIATFGNYQGDYPNPKYFDIGNGSQYAGTNLNVVGNIVITSFRGEFWKQGETNMYNMYYSDGLPLLQFGTTRFAANGAENFPEMAGNALSPFFIQSDSSDKIYGIHGGESDFSGIHLWEINGLNGIRETVIPIKYPDSRLIPPVHPGIKIITDQTFGQTINRSAEGWSGDPESLTNPTFITMIGCMNPDRFHPDIQIQFNGGSGQTKQITKQLTNSDNPLGDWQIYGQLSYQSSFPGSYDGSYFEHSYLEILDNNFKTIVSLSAVFINGPEFNMGMMINDTYIVNTSSTTMQYLYQRLTNFTIKRAGTNLTGIYSSYSGSTNNMADSSADITRPTYIRFRFVGDASGYGKVLVLNDAWFINC